LNQFVGWATCCSRSHVRLNTWATSCPPYLASSHNPSPLLMLESKTSERLVKSTGFEEPIFIVFSFGSYVTIILLTTLSRSIRSIESAFLVTSKVAAIFIPIGGGPPSTAPLPSSPRYRAWPDISHLPSRRIAPSFAQIPTSSGGIFGSELAQAESKRATASRR